MKTVTETLVQSEQLHRGPQGTISLGPLQINVELKKKRRKEQPKNLNDGKHMISNRAK